MSGDEWRTTAACAGEDTNRWFPPAGRRPDAEALLMCAGCPVWLACAQFAVDTVQLVGWWGGVPAKTLSAARRTGWLPARLIGLVVGDSRYQVGGKCGTPTGYRAHQKEGTPSCGPCREVNRRTTELWRSKHRGDYTR